jgi:hypothetical protein
MSIYEHFPLKHLFRSKHDDKYSSEKDVSKYDCRVFLVTSAEMRNEISLAMLNDASAFHFSHLRIKAAEGTPELENVIRAELNGAVKGGGSRRELINKLIDWTATPVWLKFRDNDSAQVGLSGAEAVISKNQMYILVPRLEFLEKDYVVDPETRGKMQNWQPPVDITEVHPGILRTYKPRGFPTVPVDLEGIQKYRDSQPFPQPAPA